jgi:hypothetical protein
MSKRPTWVAMMALCALGCGTLAPGSGKAPSATNDGPMASVDARAGRADGDSAAPRGAPLRMDGVWATQDLDRLPEPPWAAKALSSAHVPRELLRAWHAADNRHWCAPMMPELVRGVAVRDMPLDGGWAVVFDAPGGAGITADGDGCDRCGTSSFGIAGTAATPEDWRELGSAHLEPRFRDGSMVELEAGDGQGGALTATIVASGQGCVYQVWTFLGEDHLSDLVGGLRMVSVPAGTRPTRVAEADRR